jgi:transposase
MRHLQGDNRHQSDLLPGSLDDFVAEDHPVRVIDAFIDTLDFAALGFSKALTKETGRKPYHPGDLLKLYVYGYLNKVQTSRRLEKECQRNLELLWLMKRLQPDFKTIADFRRENAQAIKGACRAFIEFCRRAKLLSVHRVALDGSKFKAAASKDKALNRKQLKRDRQILEQQITGYLEQLDRADQQDTGIDLKREQVQETVARLQGKVMRLNEREARMDQLGSNQHCDTEEQARVMRSGRDGMVLGYNVQSAVEVDSGLIIHHEVTNDGGDNRLLQPMAEQAKAAAGTQTLEVLADAGYANGEQLAACEEQGITATVPRRKIPSSHPTLFQKQDFRYDKDTDSYVCPAGKTLPYRRDDKKRKLHLYIRKGCDSCPLQSQCTPGDTRTLTRHFYEEAYDRSQSRIKADPSLMRQRMAVAERPFAVLKQVMALRRFVCWGLEGAGSEMAIGVLGYNLNRMIARVGVPKLLAMLS